MNNYDIYYDDSIYQQAIEEDRQSTYLTTPYEALKRGNIFNELYSSYKNYRPKELTTQNEKGKMLLDIRMYNQALIDLNLYLDLHPDNKEIITLRGNYLNKYNEAVLNYERKYGPISLDSKLTKEYPWKWDENNFPWEVRY